MIRAMSESARAVPAVPTVKIDTARVRITEWRFPPGGATGWHRHEYDYVVVPMTTGPLAIMGAGGAVTTSNLVTGEPYARTAGVEHDVRNPNPTEFVFIEIELKEAPVSA
jgi:quercetin dioxygenase-like cupin family protein